MILLCVKPVELCNVLMSVAKQPHGTIKQGHDTYNGYCYFYSDPPTVKHLKSHSRTGNKFLFIMENSDITSYSYITISFNICQHGRL